MQQLSLISKLPSAKQLLYAGIIFASMIVSLAGFQTSNAADLSQFKAGRIIDDSVLSDKGSLSANEIQSFLNSKVTNCDTNGTQTSEYGGGTRAQWGAAKYGQSTFTCIKDYSEGGKSAAQIIYDTAQEFQISPKVLIVLLQKEQALITDTWPLNIQYRSATGYGCPDTAPCDSQYYGLTNQLRWSARMFRAILNNSPTWYTPYLTGNNYIQYNPTASCGGSTVYIENRATQAMYNYTPYQPNQGALAAGYGTASCGAYGNRNFWLYYNDWFGSTYAPSYRWEPSTQAAYTDSSLSTPIDLNNLTPDSQKRIYVVLRAKNAGTSTWYKNAINLGTSQQQNRISGIYDQTWLSPSRTATLSENQVAPGDYGTFKFWINRPPSAGTIKEYFNVVAEGVTWLNDMGQHFTFNTQPPKYSWSSEGQTAFTDSSKQSNLNYNQIVAGDRAYMVVRAKNTGNVTWSKESINFATIGPNNRQSTVASPEWFSPNRAATLKEVTVAPGATGTFEFWVDFSKAGTFREYFSPVAEGIAWMNDIGFYYEYTVKPAVYKWEPAGQSAYLDATKAQAIDTKDLVAGQRIYLQIRAKNAGNVIWYKNNLNLATAGPQNRLSSYQDSTWYSVNRPASITENTVKPGDIGTFEFWVKVPAVNGTRREYFNLVSEYNAWFNDLGLYYDFKTI